MLRFKNFLLPVRSPSEMPVVSSLYNKAINFYWRKAHNRASAFTFCSTAVERQLSNDDQTHTIRDGNLPIVCPLANFEMNGRPLS